jgi:hypothetical protein
MLYQDDEALFGECDPIGESLFTDLDGRKFYSGVVVHNLTVRIGDTVRVNLENDDEDEEEAVSTKNNGKRKRKGAKEDSYRDREEAEDNDSDNIGYCQVFAIFDDPNPDKGVLFEARWFTTPEELAYADRKKRM